MRLSISLRAMDKSLDYIHGVHSEAYNKYIFFNF